MMNSHPEIPPSPVGVTASDQRKNGVSALYFLLSETSDGWTDPAGTDGNLEGGLQTGPCTALGCHGDRCMSSESSPWLRCDHPWIDTSQWPKGKSVRGKRVLPAWSWALGPSLP